MPSRPLARRGRNLYNNDKPTGDQTRSIFSINKTTTIYPEMYGYHSKPNGRPAKGPAGKKRK